MTGATAGPGPTGVHGLAGLARQVARLALEAGGRDGKRYPVRVGIDGPVEADTAALADAVTRCLTDDAVPVARVRARDFVRPRSVRLEYGRDDPDAFYDLWYDFPALRREVLDPLAPGGRGTWLPRLRDPDTDRSARVQLVDAAAGTVLVVDGRFLLRDDVRAGFDVLVHLDVSEPARRRRLPPDESARVLPGWQRYLDECRPAAHADLVARFDHPTRPALLPRSSRRPSRTSANQHPAG